MRLNFRRCHEKELESAREEICHVGEKLDGANWMEKSPRTDKLEINLKAMDARKADLMRFGWI